MFRHLPIFGISMGGQEWNSQYEAEGRKRGRELGGRETVEKGEAYLTCWLNRRGFRQKH